MMLGMPRGNESGKGGQHTVYYIYQYIQVPVPTSTGSLQPDDLNAALVGVTFSVIHIYNTLAIL